jgi:hypothetical protein
MQVGDGFHQCQTQARPVLREDQPEQNRSNTRGVFSAIPPVSVTTISAPSGFVAKEMVIRPPST